MLDAIDKKLLSAVADLESLPKGAYNIRKNGQLLNREVTANIDIRTNDAQNGIVIDIKPGTTNESVHIPVILSQAGLHDTVYNTFNIGADADVTIIAGCGIHCGGKQSEGHEGIHDFHVGPGARVRYVEKHVAIGEGTGKRILNPTTRVFLNEDSYAEFELVQNGGVDMAKRVNEAQLKARSTFIISERVLTDGAQEATSHNLIKMLGADSRSNLVSRSVIRDQSLQNFYVTLEAHEKCFGHIECDAIIMDQGRNETVPGLKALHPDAELTHEASIGKIANEQLVKLMSMGLTYDEAVNKIIECFMN